MDGCLPQASCWKAVVQYTSHITNIEMFPSCVLFIMFVLFTVLLAVFSCCIVLVIVA